MPSAPLHPCSGSPTCPVRLPRGVSRCATHARQQEHQRPNWDVRRWYRTSRWRVLRQQVVNEEPVCRKCRQSPTEDVDHVQKHEGDEGLFFSRANLQGLCKRCHSAKTGRGL